MSTVDTTFSGSRNERPTRQRSGRTRARDVMTTEVISARPDMASREIAKLLLDNNISALPVVDGSGAVIGMVSEGDLIGREEMKRVQRRDWWLELVAEGKPPSAESLSNARRPESTARQIMSSPVVTVGEDTDTSEIARLLNAHRIKRVPVVRDGRIVGIVSRENLLRALAEEQPRPEAKPKSGFLAEVFADIDRHFKHGREEHQTSAAGAAARRVEAGPSVDDFRALVEDHESKESQHREEQRRSAAEQRKRSVAELIDRHISDESWRSLLHRARLAAEQGEKEFLLLRFPSPLCSDGGRALNMAEPGWPATLRGEAAEMYLRWEKDLMPLGFRLAARVLDYPGDMPGDIGLFLVWRQ